MKKQPTIIGIVCTFKDGYLYMEYRTDLYYTSRSAYKALNELVESIDFEDDEEVVSYCVLSVKTGRVFNQSRNELYINRLLEAVNRAFTCELLASSGSDAQLILRGETNKLCHILGMFTSDLYGCNRDYNAIIELEKGKCFPMVGEHDLFNMLRTDGCRYALREACSEATDRNKSLNYRGKYIAVCEALYCLTGKNYRYDFDAGKMKLLEWG